MNLEVLQTYESVVYTGAYFGAMAVVALWEAWAPRRWLRAPLRVRWLNNFGAAILNTLISRAVFPAVGVAVAFWAQANQFGLFNALEVPAWFAFVVALLVLDFSRYGQHWALHRVPFLWLVHRCHHTDRDYDFTTGLRFHPFEAFLSTAAQLGVIAALGAPIAAVAVHEILFVVASLMVHANGRLPLRADRVLRRFLITPDFHRVHHSTVFNETNSNFGGIMPWWDYLFGTYVAEPKAGQEKMSIGLPEFWDEKHLKLGWMLANPFLSADAEVVQGSGRPAPSATKRAEASAPSSK